MKIDISSHIQPQKYTAALQKKILPELFAKLNHNYITTLIDMDQRFRITDKFPDRVEILSVTIQPPELLAPDAAVELAQIANDEMAELMAKYPKRFITAMAVLPWNNIDAAIKEAERAIKDLNFKCVVIWANLGGKPIDMPPLMPFYAMMEKYDLPIFIHPMFPTPTCATPEGFKSAAIFMGPEMDNAFALHRTLEIPMGTTVASTRLVLGHVFDKFPKLKFILHHAGSIIPYMAGRLVLTEGMREKVEKVDHGLKKPLLDYYKMFYVDTALHGNIPAMMCSQSFYGTEHMLFGTDFPFDGELGLFSLQSNIDQIEKSGLSKEDKVKIFEGNAKKFFHLS